MIFSNPTAIRSAWRDTVRRSGQAVVLNPSLAAKELSKGYTNPTDAEARDIDNLVAAVSAGAYHVVEGAGYRDVAVTQLSSRLGLPRERAAELVEVLAPERMPAVNPSPKAAASQTGKKRPGRRRRQLLGALVLAGLGTAGWFVVQREQRRSDQISHLRSEIERRAEREAVLTKKELALVETEAKVKELEAEVGTPGTDGGPGTGLTGELDVAQAKVRSLESDLANAKAQIPTESSSVSIQGYRQDGPLAVRTTEFEATLTLGDGCDPGAGCNARATLTTPARFSPISSTEVAVELERLANASAQLTLGGAWAGDGVLQESLGATCNGEPLTGPVSVIMIPVQFMADDTSQRVEISGFRVVVTQPTPTCGGGTLSYSGTVTAGS